MKREHAWHSKRLTSPSKLGVLSSLTSFGGLPGAAHLRHDEEAEDRANHVMGLRVRVRLGLVWSESRTHSKRHESMATGGMCHAAANLLGPDDVFINTMFCPEMKASKLCR